MASHSQLIKQIAAGRRKCDMTRKEYFDHRYQVHGSIADAPRDENDKPCKYIQTQIFDSAFGSRAGGPLNANQHWTGRDDLTELFFHDWDHLTACFTSQHVKTRVGPDGPKFADFETSMVLMAQELPPVDLNTRLRQQKFGGDADLSHLERGDATVATFFLSTSDNEKEGANLEKMVTPAFKSALEEQCQDDVYGLIVNVGVVSSKFDLNAYFGGADMPQYALVYKAFMKDNSSVTAVRKAQKALMKVMGDQLDPHDSFVTFGREALIMDVDKGYKFDPEAQPIFGDLPGPSHLE